MFFDRDSGNALSSGVNKVPPPPFNQIMMSTGEILIRITEDDNCETLKGSVLVVSQPKFILSLRCYFN